jgi:hypothetical protein
MKKQLLIAAIAATMGTAAIADVAITGAALVKFVNTDITGVDTNVVSNEFDLDINGSHGSTTVNMHIDSDNGTNTMATKMTTSIAVFQLLLVHTLVLSQSYLLRQLKLLNQ